MTTLTLKLPEAIFRQLANLAKLTHQSVESLAIQSIESNLPPHLEEAPLETPVSLRTMQTLDIEELLKMAHSQLSTFQQQRLLILLERHQTTPSITEAERLELRALRTAADELMLTKAYAWALLRGRGYQLPTLEQLPVV
jgi:predicted transcriptional regulator